MEYMRLTKAWQQQEKDQNPTHNTHKKIIDKDVARTDRDHWFYAGDGNPHLSALRRVLLAHTILDPELGKS